MHIRYFLLAVGLLILYACKKGSSSPIVPQTPIGEVNVQLGDNTTGDILAYSVIKDPGNGFIISGAKWLYDSSAGYLNYFPFSLAINNNNLHPVSSKLRLTNDVGAAVQSVMFNNFIYTLINIGDPFTNTSDKNIRIIKTDTANNIIWSKRIDNTMAGSSITILHDGNLLVQGRFGTDIWNLENNPLFLMKMDSDGKILFRRDFANQFYYGSKDIVEDANYYTLVAYQPGFSAGTSTLVPVLLQLNLFGYVVSVKPFEPFMRGSEHYFASFHLRKNKNGGFIIATCYTDIIAPTGGGVINEYFNIKILGASGAVLHSVDLQTAGNNKKIFEVPDVLQTQDGNIYVLVCCDTGTDWYTEILKFDPQGNYISFKDMLPGKFPVALCEADNNNFIMLLNYSAGNSVTILKMDGGLNVL